MAQRKRQSKVAAKESPNDTALGGVVALLMLIASVGGCVFILPAVATILAEGKICNGRAGCRSWSSHPWLLSVELFGYLFILLMLGCVAFGCVSFIMKPKDRDAE